MNGNPFLANCGKTTKKFHILHRSKGRLWTAQPAFFPPLEDPDEQDDDQNDQENGAESNVHPPLPPFGHSIGSPGERQQTASPGRKSSPRASCVAMDGKLVLRLGLLTLVLVALVGALAQLAAGRRPVLLGGSV